jgi:hypothetical protein
MVKKALVLVILAFFVAEVYTFPLQDEKPGKFVGDLSQEKSESTSKKTAPIVLSRIKGQVQLDGLSDESAWEGIEPLPIIMQIPVFCAEPSEKTEVLIAYDDDYLYAAGRLFDSEPSKIQITSKQRDFLGGNSDYFGIIIDSFNDKENGLGFFTTPAGLRMDTTIFNDAVGFDQTMGGMPLNISWNTFWDVAVSTNEEGWFVEMRIPLSSLRFQDKDGQVVMGLITWRYIPRKFEIDCFPEISPEFGFWSTWKPSQAGEVVLEGVASRNPLYITPYLLGGDGRSFELNDEETAYDRFDDPTFESGLDVKYGLTSNLTLDITLNPDFAQVEADDQQVNLTRFSLFFPEKRLFFQERSSNFEFNLGGPNRMFYSRRIGIYEEELVRIYGGFRLVGRIGSWDLGFLSMQTAPVLDLRSENFGVLRIRRRVFNPYSYIGGIVTSRIGTDGTYNIGYGLDGIIRVFGEDYLSFHWVQTFEDGEMNKFASLEPTRIGFGWERRTIKGLGYNLSFSRAGESFEPGLGFEMREDYTRFGNRILFGWLPGEESFLQSHSVFVDGFVVLSNEDGSIESLELGPGYEIFAKKGYGATLSFKAYKEYVDEEFELSDDAEVPIGRYDFLGVMGMFRSPMGSKLATVALFNAGSFYDGWRISFTAMPLWSVSSSLDLSGMYQFNIVEFPDRGQKFIAHIARLKAIYMLSTKFSASAFIQYNGAIDAVIANFRLRYNPREGNDLYLVYNEVLNTNRYRELPTVPASTGRAIMIKYSYTFNVKK